MEQKIKIFFASGNAHKKAEMQRLITPLCTVVLPKEEGLTFDADENGDSFIENALIKAKTLYKIVKAPVLSDDSGLVVEALDGRPGIHTSRYGCEERQLTSQEQYNLLLKEMEGRKNRRAYFVSACVLMLDEERIFIVQEKVPGYIASEPRGIHGFGYDPIFLVEESGKSASELSDDEKDALSHRGRAMRKINLLLESELK